MSNPEFDDKAAFEEREVETPEPSTKEAGGLQGGKSIAPVLTTASEQDAAVAPDLQWAAVAATMAAGIYWIIQLYTITILAAYSRNIVEVLGDSPKQAWVLNAFNVVTVVCAPILSYFADIHGRKWFIVVPLIFGAAGAAIASRAESMTVVIIGCAFIGIGGSPLGVATAVPSEVLPHRHRSIGQAVVFTLSAFGAIIGLLGISKAISVDSVNGWRWIFYSLVAGFVVEAVFWVLVYHPPRRQTVLTEQRPKLDYIGYALLIIASVLFLTALTWGGVAYSWKSPQVLATLVIGIVAYIVFGAWEWKGRTDGILHHDLFQNRNFPLTVLAIFIEGFVSLAFLSLYPGQVATVYQPDVFKAGQLSTPFQGAFILALPIGGLYVAKTRDTVSPIFVGYVIFTASIIGLACSHPNTKGLFVAMNALAGLGFSQPLAFLTVVAQFAAPAYLIATSSAIVLSVRALGGALGIAIVTTVLETKESAKIPAYIAAATIPLGLNPQQLGPVIGAATGDATLIAAIEQGHIPGITGEILGAAFEAAHSAFSDSYRYAWITLIPFGVLGCLSILVLKRNREQLDYIVDAPLQHIHHTHGAEHEA